MDDEARKGRREERRQRLQRQRRLALVGGIAAIALVVVVAVVLLGGGSDGGATDADASPAKELPRGGREILPRDRVVALYGNPRARELGALGIGSPDKAAQRLEKQAKAYVRPGRPVLPAFELISTLVTEEEGEDGEHALHEEAKVIRRYLHAARAHHMLLILDIQPGYASFIDEAKRLEPYLKEPGVSLALDPEWSLEPPALPGQEVGSTDAATINEVSSYLSGLVRRYDLPQKLLVVHRFTEEMLESEGELERDPGVALVLNVDGVGDRPNKVSKYHQLAHQRKGAFNGFKLFYEEDENLMTPSQVLKLRPLPDLIVYE